MKDKKSFNPENIKFDEEEISKEYSVGFEYESSDGKFYNGTLTVMITPVGGMVRERYEVTWVDGEPPEYTKKDEERIYEAYRSNF